MRLSPHYYGARVMLCSNQAVLLTGELLYPQVINLIHVCNVCKLDVLHFYWVLRWHGIKHLAHMPASHNKLWPGSEAPSVCVQARWQPGCCERSGSALWGCLGPAPHCSPSQPRAWVLQIAHEPVIWSQNKIQLSNLNWFFFFFKYGHNNKTLKGPPAEDNTQRECRPGDANKPWKPTTNWSQILCPLGLGVLVWNINISKEFIFHSLLFCCQGCRPHWLLDVDTTAQGLGSQMNCNGLFHLILCIMDLFSCFWS